MRLAIADPPYFGRAAVWYGDAMTPSQTGKNRGGTANISGPKPSDFHPDAAEWDTVAAHSALVHRLIADYDGWAIAMAHDNLRTYLPLIPAAVPIRIGIWRKPQNMPSGARVINTWEPVIVRIPEGRRASTGAVIFPPDSISVGRLNSGFVGAKPPQWTRWVLDMLGYQDDDTVDDLFPGSGAVSLALAQTAIDFGGVA